MHLIEGDPVEISHKMEGFGHGLETLIVKAGNETRGFLSYSRSTGEEIWELTVMNVYEGFQGRGIGRLLIQEFVKRVGSNQPVHCEVSHDETKELAIKKYREAKTLGKYYIPQDQFVELPFTRILNSGGIEVTEISITLDDVNPEDTPFEVEFWGKTK